MTSRWTEEEAKAYGLVKDKDGNWSKGKTGVQRRDSREVSKLESDADWNKERQVRQDREDAKRGNARYRIEVTAHCRRHTDPDNLCPKYFIDRLKEFKIIPDDSSEYVWEFVKRVKKVESWEPEVTEIEVFELEGS